jgi:hypothetical protein
MQCSVCKDLKLDTEFSPSELKPQKARPNTRPSLRCLECMAVNKLKSRYNLSVEDYIHMYEHQEGKCAICDLKPQQKDFYIDHDHSTGKVRALLCKHCNSGIGLLKECPRIMRNAIKYVTYFSTLKTL